MEKEEIKKEEQPTEVTVETTTVKEGVEGEQPAAAEKSAKDIFHDTIRSYAPDENLDEDENAIYSKANEMIKSLQEKGAALDRLNEKLLNRFQEDPTDAAAWLDFAEGMPLVAAIVKNKGREALNEPAEGDEGWEDFQKALEERHQHDAEMNEMVDKIRTNSEESQARFEKLMKDRGFSEEEASKFWDFIHGDMDKLSIGNLDDEFLERAMRMYNYDKDMAAAIEQGRSEGRNEKLEEEHRRMKGSGLPNGGGGANASEELGDVKSDNKTAAWLSNVKHRQ